MAAGPVVSSSAPHRPRLNFWQVFNMSFGFFGIQFGWDLQRANMGPIYEYLDAEPEQIPLLFLAAPLTGLIVQPIIGYMSDRTWHPWWGRRRPYFFVGAILSSICLFLMPNSGVLWMAAGLLWILDTAGNIAMEPFRAFVADKLPEQQRTSGFAMQSLMIGLGGSIASALPWLLANIFDVASTPVDGSIPPSVKYAFYIGGAMFLLAVMYTIFSTREYPPTDVGFKEKIKESNKGFGGGAKEIWHSIMNMPPKMKQLALVQFFTWPGLFLMWFYYSTAVARNVFGAASEKDELYTKGVEFAGLTLSFYNVVAFVFALMIPFIARNLGRRLTHTLCLLCGAAGLIAVGFVTDRYMLYACMTGVGIAWASILSMPYAMLAGSLPENKIGVYMGIFNFFIVLPEIIASLFFGQIMEHLLNNNRMLAVQIGGALMILAALICYFIVKERKNEHVKEDVVEEVKITEQRPI
ncbi:MAG TPA: MFS transporter [Chitinophagaceae bacterium]|nr:MFS transporter [Chitinophagaceae bacterium]